jgi:alpha-tubulin suppressor-like RCC1 family protein
VQVVGLTAGATAVTANNHSCAIVSGGLQCWGYNYGGELGNNTSSHSPTPVQVLGLTSGVTAVDASGGKTCAIVNGSVYCWGNNFDGELGNGTTTSSLIPVKVNFP